VTAAALTCIEAAAQQNSRILCRCCVPRRRQLVNTAGRDAYGLHQSAQAVVRHILQHHHHCDRRNDERDDGHTQQDPPYGAGDWRLQQQSLQLHGREARKRRDTGHVLVCETGGGEGHAEIGCAISARSPRRKRRSSHGEARRGSGPVPYDGPKPVLLTSQSSGMRCCRTLLTHTRVPSSARGSVSSFSRGNRRQHRAAH